MSPSRGLSAPWWAGVGVILATALALLGIFWPSSPSSSNTITGNCNAQGTHNTVNCTGSTSKKAP